MRKAITTENQREKDRQFTLKTKRKARTIENQRKKKQAIHIENKEKDKNN